MVLSNQIAGFCNLQYLWKEISQYLRKFLDGGSHEGKVASETVSFAVPSQTQICMDLPVLPFGKSVADGYNKNVQNERLINF